MDLRKVEPTNDDDQVLHLIKACVQEIWNQYDWDQSQTLDRQETKQFVLDTLKIVQEESKFSQQDFDNNFDAVDTDNSGAIDKSEMVQFLLKLLDLGLT